MKWSAIPERIRTVLLWAPIPIIMIIISPYTAWIIFALLAVIGTLEWRKIILKSDQLFYDKSTRLSLIGAVLAMILALYNIYFSLTIPILFAIIAYRQERVRFRNELILAQIVPSWVGIMAYSVRSGPDGLAMLGLILVITIISDSAAYFVGRAYGKHKFAPVISPNKTWEGAIGGWVFAIIAAWIYCYFFVPSVAALPNWLEIMFFWLLALAGQMGDLAESAIKRKHKIKDSGTIFPGHGGVLDRFDSFAAVIIVMEVMLLIMGL